MKPPEVGLHDGVPNEHYHRWDAASNSRLTYLERSAEFCRWKVENPDEGTWALGFGSAVHAAVLEPDALEARYVPEPLEAAPNPESSGAKLTKGYKAAAEKLRAQGYTLLRPQDFDACRYIRDRIAKHPTARDLVANASRLEASGLAQDPETGVLTKVRPDILHESAGVLGELKTTRDATERAFVRQAIERRYYRGTALYRAVLDWLGVPVPHNLYLIVENTAPYEVRVRSIEPAAVEKGAAEFRVLLDRYARCLAENVWPGPPAEVTPIEFPNWFYRQEFTG